jgi:hypothetical protein
LIAISYISIVGGTVCYGNLDGTRVLLVVFVIIFMLKIKSIIKPLIFAIKYQLSKIYIKKLLGAKTEIFLEVGAGNKQGINGWVTIDMTRNCDICWDLRNGIPFPAESVLKIYSSHFFEHLSFQVRGC